MESDNNLIQKDKDEDLIANLSGRILNLSIFSDLPLEDSSSDEESDNSLKTQKDTPVSKLQHMMALQLDERNAQPPIITENNPFSLSSLSGKVGKSLKKKRRLNS
jgi:hypothetical protein